jgi:hypothetical protein
MANVFMVLRKENLMNSVEQDISLEADSRSVIEEISGLLWELKVRKSHITGPYLWPDTFSEHFQILFPSTTLL